ncbi:MAG TPA: TonB family protein [Gammaproteobacteria bacterium]|nr:TonB family protein [Gammaproteobacteria bacterium]
MTPLLNWLAGMSLSAGLVLLLIFCLRKPLARWLGAEYAYYLWLLVPLHVLGNLLLPKTIGVAPIDLPLTLIATPGTAVAQSAGSPTAVWLLSGMWIVGAAYCLARLLLELIALRRLVRQSRPATSDALSPTGPSDIPVGFSTAISTPVAAGWLKPLLLLPEDFTRRYSSEEQTLIVSHEKTHMQRRDNLCNLLARLIGCVFWFHPLFIVAQRCYRFDQEIACDALVLRQCHSHERQVYGHALVKSAVRRPAVAVVSPWQSRSTIKERIMTLNTHHKKPLRNLVAGALLAPVLVIGTLSLSTNVMADGNSTAPKGAIPITAITPYYPKSALKNGVEGRVTLEFTIASNGKAEDIEVLRSSPAGVFDKAAIKALSNSVFKPASGESGPKATRATFTYIFHLPPKKTSAENLGTIVTQPADPSTTK